MTHTPCQPTSPCTRHRTQIERERGQACTRGRSRLTRRATPGNKHDHAGALEHLKFENSARCFASPPRRAWRERDEPPLNHSPLALIILFTIRNCVTNQSPLAHVSKSERPPTRASNLQQISYPERNFGWNQLLDSSIGLSPLCPTDAMDLHVTTATGLHPSFLGLHPRQA